MIAGRGSHSQRSHLHSYKRFTVWSTCIRTEGRPSFYRATSRNAGLSLIIFRVRYRLPRGQNYPGLRAFIRLQHSSLPRPQPMREKTALTICVSHWRSRGFKKYFPLFTQDPCQHVKVVPMSRDKLGGHSNGRAQCSSPRRARCTS